jgi:predicted MFS family arabinose efflux permease
MLMISFAVAPLSPQLFPLAFALFFLGLGWNFCFVAGSALLADQLSPAERSRTQGFNDLLISLVTALGSFSSGLIFAANGYGPLNVVTAALTLAMLALVVWWYAVGRERAPVVAES